MGSRRLRHDAARRFFPLRGEHLEPRTLLALTPQLLMDINVAQAGVRVGGPIVEMNGTAYFPGRVADGYHALWQSDGTTEGTYVFREMRTHVPHTENHFGDVVRYSAGFANVNGTLFFGANDGLTGTELWKSDG
jgi:ELWxxDGT repeat protein